MLTCPHLFIRSNDWAASLLVAAGTLVVAMGSWGCSDRWADWRRGNWSGHSGGGPSLPEALVGSGVWSEDSQWWGLSTWAGTGVWWEDATSWRGSPQSQVARSAVRRPSSEVAGSSADVSVFSRSVRPRNSWSSGRPAGRSRKPNVHHVHQYFDTQNMRDLSHEEQ